MVLGVLNLDGTLSLNGFEELDVILRFLDGLSDLFEASHLLSNGPLDFQMNIRVILSEGPNAFKPILDSPLFLLQLLFDYAGLTSEPAGINLIALVASIPHNELAHRLAQLLIEPHLIGNRALIDPVQANDVCALL